MLECVVNVSEGRDAAVIDALRTVAGACLLDVHTDRDHHRSVLTLAGPGGELGEAVRAVTVEAVRRIDLRHHAGAHPRLGAVDVVPFVPLAGATLDDAVEVRNRFAVWAGATLQLPCFLYGPERSLPDVRRQAFRTLHPDFGPADPHPSAGATCVGARPVLVAYNVWLTPGTPVGVAQRVAAEIRTPQVRALGLGVGGQAQVSFNLIDPAAAGPDHAYDAVAARTAVDRAELVGLVPAMVLESIPAARWSALDLDSTRTIESRLHQSRRSGHAGRPTPTRRSRDAGRGPAGDGGDAARAR